MQQRPLLIRTGLLAIGVIVLFAVMGFPVGGGDPSTTPSPTQQKELSIDDGNGIEPPTTALASPPLVEVAQPTPSISSVSKPPSTISHLTLSTFFDNQWVMRTSDDYIGKKKREKGAAAGDVSVVVLPVGMSAPPSFYKGNRKVPSMDWIEIFVRSLAHHTFGTPRVHASIPLQQQPSHTGGLVFFVDPFSAIVLQRRLVDLVEAGFVLLVAIFPPSSVLLMDMPDRVPREAMPLKAGSGDEEGGASPSSGGGFTVRKALQLLGIPYVSPSYLDEDWVTTVPNGANNFRFSLYQDWLSKEFEKDDTFLSMPNVRRFVSKQVTIRKMRVLIADSTDVAFQANPFIPSDIPVSGATPLPVSRGCFPPTTGPGKQSLVFTLESGAKTFKNEKYNRRWMSCYDKEGSNLLKKMEVVHAPISCAGVTLGSGRAILAYLHDQLAELHKPALVFCASNDIKATLDQATHNAILFQRKQRFLGKSPPGEVVKDEVGVSVTRKLVGGGVVDAVRVARHDDDHCTFHGNFGKLKLVTREDTSSSNKDAQLLTITSGSDLVAVNRHNVPYLIVHQYSSNRHPPLMKVLKERYLLSY